MPSVLIKIDGERQARLVPAEPLERVRHESTPWITLGMHSLVTRLVLGARRAPSRQQRPVKHEWGFKVRAFDWLVALSLLPMAAALGGGVTAQEARATGPPTG